MAWLKECLSKEADITSTSHWFTTTVIITICHLHFMTTIPRWKKAGHQQERFHPANPHPQHCCFVQISWFFISLPKWSSCATESKPPTPAPPPPLPPELGECTQDVNSWCVFVFHLLVGFVPNLTSQKAYFFLILTNAYLHISRWWDKKAVLSLLRNWYQKSVVVEKWIQKINPNLHYLSSRHIPWLLFC